MAGYVKDVQNQFTYALKDAFKRFDWKIPRYRYTIYWTISDNNKYSVFIFGVKFIDKNKKYKTYLKGQYRIKYRDSNILWTYTFH